MNHTETNTTYALRSPITKRFVVSYDESDATSVRWTKRIEDAQTYNIDEARKVRNHLLDVGQEVRIRRAPSVAKLYEQYRDLAKQVAFKIVGICPQLHETMDEAESYLGILLTATDSSHAYDPTRGHRSTWIGRLMRWHLLTHFQQKSRKTMQRIDDSIIDKGGVSALGMMSDEAEAAFGVLREDPEKYKITFAYSNCKKKYAALLVERFGWSRQTIQRVFRELTEIVTCQD